MLKYAVRNIEQAFVYIADCNLATVANMAMTKSRPKGEFKRQKNIAQSMIDWIVFFKIDSESTRAENIINNFSGSVDAWANQFDVLLKDGKK